MTFPRVRLSQLVGVCSEDSRAELGAWQDAHPHTDLSAALDAVVVASPPASASPAASASRSPYLSPHSSRSVRRSASSHGSHSSWDSHSSWGSTRRTATSRSSIPRGSHRAGRTRFFLRRGVSARIEHSEARPSYARSPYATPSHAQHSDVKPSSASTVALERSASSHSTRERTHLLPRLSWRAPSALALICLLTLALTCSLTLLLIQARNNTDFLISTAEISAGETKTRPGTIGYGQDNSPGSGSDSSLNAGSEESSSAIPSAQSEPKSSSQQAPSQSPSQQSEQQSSQAPSSKESASQPADPCATGICVDGKVNLNTANEQQLQTVKGIGPQLASKIITFRNQTGKLTSLDQLDSIPGVGPKMLEKWRDSLVVR